MTANKENNRSIFLKFGRIFFFIIIYMPLSKSPLVSPDMTVTSAVPVSVLPDQKHLLH